MIPLFSTFNPSNLKRVFAALGAALAAEHKGDGTHGDVTADSVAVAGALSAGGDATITGEATINGIEISSAISGGPGGTGSGPGFKVPDVSGAGSWAQYASTDNFGDSWGWFDVDNATEVLKLYRTVGGYQLGPSEDGLSQVSLGSETDSDMDFAVVAGVKTYARTAFYERLRTTPVGEWITVAYDSANFTASAGTWTVDAGDQLAYAYTLVGKTMTLVLSIDNTDVSSIAVLRLAIPGGFTSARTTINPIITQDAGTFGVGIAYVGAGGTNVFFYPSAAFNSFSVTSGDNTSVWGEITFEVQ